MAITYVGGDTGTSGDDTSITLTLPTHQADDFAIIHVSSYRTFGSGTPVLGCSGYTERFQATHTAGADQTVACFYVKLASGSESDPVVTTDNADYNWSACLAVYRGVDTTTPFDVATTSSDGQNTNNPTNPAITTSNANSAILLFHSATNNDHTVAGAPSGYTLGEYNIAGNNSYQFNSHLLDAGAAATETPGAWTHTASPEASDYAVYTHALRLGAGSETSTGAPSLPLITSSGTAEDIQTATGAPSIPLLTSSGTAEVENTSTGAASIPLLTSSGTATQFDIRVEGTTGTTTTSQTTHTIDYPTTVTTGSRLLAVTTYDGTASGIAANGIWTLNKSYDRSGGGPSIAVFSAIAGAGLGGGTWNFTTTSSVSTETRIYSVVNGGIITFGTEDTSTGSSINTSNLVPSGGALNRIFWTVGSSSDGGVGTSTGYQGDTDRWQIFESSSAAHTGVWAHIIENAASEDPSAWVWGASHDSTGLTIGMVENLNGAKSGSGAPTVPLLTTSGSAKLGLGATGAPTVPLLTTTGVAENEQTSSGAPTIPLLTSAGTSVVSRSGTGAPTIPLITSAGTAVDTQTSTGAPTIPLITSAGTASTTSATTSSGAPTVPLLTTSGTAKLGLPATGAPTIPLLTTTGVAEDVQTSTGAPTVPLLTTSGTATHTKAGTGAPTIPLITSAGVSVLVLPSSGAPSLPLLTSAGTAEDIQTSSGTSTLPLITSSGASVLSRAGTGAPVLPLITSAGTANTNITGDGAPTIPMITSAATTDLTTTQTATGSPTIPLITSAAVAGPWPDLTLNDNAPAPGDTITATIDVAFPGVITQLINNAGDILTAEAGATTTTADFILTETFFVNGGTLNNSDWTIDLTPYVTDGTSRSNTDAMVMTVAESAGPTYYLYTATGSPTGSIHLPIGAVSGDRIYFTVTSGTLFTITTEGIPIWSSTPGTGTIKAFDVSETEWTVLQDILPWAGGNPVLPALTSAGSALKTIVSTGEPTIPLLTSSSTAENIQTSTGAAVIPLLTSAGTADTRKVSTGSPTVPLLTSSSTAEVVHPATGAAVIPLLTSSGTASMDRAGTGAPILPLLTASGSADTSDISSLRSRIEDLEAIVYGQLTVAL